MNKRVVKIGRNILFMLSVPAIIGAFVFADVTTRNEVCKGIQVSFSNNQLSFVTKQNVSDILESNGIKADKTQLRNIHINELEKSIEHNKWVKNADIFVSADNRIHIRIEQKTPLVRIQPANDFEEPYYLDEYGNIILYSEQYIPDLPVVTAPAIGYNSADIALKADIVKLSKYISKDTFWNAAITQISVDSNRIISLIPAFGTQQIILGNVKDLDNKMCKLFQFYQQGYHTVNWDKYDEIDLRFERQVVCRNTRGQRISVDPYDKTTHKDIIAFNLANENNKTNDVAEQIPNSKIPRLTPGQANSKGVIAASKVVNPAPKVANPAPKVVTTVPKAVTTEPVLAAAKPVSASVVKEAVKPIADKPAAKETVKVITEKPVVKKTPAKTESASAKPATKEKTKAKAAVKETKPVMTEVQESKYFK